MFILLPLQDHFSKTDLGRERASLFVYTILSIIVPSTSSMTSNEQQGSVIEGDTRRSLVIRFPSGALYSEENNGIYIVAVMHLHRFPDYWKHRK